MKKNSERPYLIRAIHEWIVDNECTPNVQVNCNYPNVQVPQNFVSDGQIVLNIGPSAVQNLVINNLAITFSGRFGGVAQDIHVPINAVLSIFARENQRGMSFDLLSPEDIQFDQASNTTTKPTAGKATTSKSAKKLSHLHIVK